MLAKRNRNQWLAFDNHLNCLNENMRVDIDSQLQFIIYKAMRIRDRSTVYLYSISICMGSFVLGYELTSYGNLTHLLSQANQFQNEETYVEMSTLLTSLLAIAAIFGMTRIIQESPFIGVPSRLLATLTPSAMWTI